MPFQNDKLQNRNKIAYLGALTLLFSYAETILPRFTPFFRLGFANIAILFAFNLDFSSFIILELIKSFASSLLSGTLFSPFLIISVSQSVSSGFAMYIIFKANKLCNQKLFSIYGISMIGSAVSAIVQIGLAKLYLGEGTLALFGPILIFNCVAGISTAFLSRFFKIPENPPLLSVKEETKKCIPNPILVLCALLVFSIMIFTVKNWIFLATSTILSFIIQKISGRKIMLAPHIFMWLFIIISSLFIPNGKVLFKIAELSITQGALYEGLEKSMRLSAVSALSQCTANLRPYGSSIIGLSLAYYRGLLEIFHSTDGKLLKKIKTALETEKM